MLSPSIGFAMTDASAIDHVDDFGLNQSKIINVIDSNHLERDAGGKPLHTFPHPAQESSSGWTLNYRRILNIVFWICAASGSVVFIEPSPYDFLILLTALLWIIGGFTVHRAVMPFVILLAIWVLGGYIALIPYWAEPDPTDFMAHTLFIATTGIFYALFFSDNTKQRIDICLKGYTFSCVLAAVIAVVTWIGTFGSGEDLIRDGRAMLPFKDPNVLGSYMVPGILYLIQKLLLGRTKFLLLTLACLGASATALFLSFSRGSWAAAMISIVLLTGMSLYTADSRRMRRRILFSAAIVIALTAIAILLALSNDQIREFFFQRATLTQDYDEGPTGRFGNQLRSIPMLLERPNGFGPLRFRLTFGLEPHNAFINAFASNGWLGGFAFIALVLMTGYVGFKGSLTASPYLRQMQVIWCATFVFFLQALQIDIDHWRMFYITFGAVWGLETARVRWIEAGRPSFRKSARLQASPSPS
jgi:O-antigen ligase